MLKSINGTGIDRDDLEEALVRWQRGDTLMALFYLDRAGFHGIEVMLRSAA